MYITGYDDDLHSSYIFKTYDAINVEHMDLAVVSADYLNAIWGADDNDIWAVGNNGLIYHYYGTGWELQPPIDNSSLDGIWGTSTDNLYIVGCNSTILHWNGVSLTKEEAPTQDICYRSVWGTGWNNIYIVGNSGTIIVHYNGTDWQNVIVSDTSEYFIDIVGRNATEMYISAEYSIFRFDGTNLSRYNIPTSGGDYEHIVLGPHSSDIYAVNWDGEVLYFDGAIWRSEMIGTAAVNDIGIRGNTGFLMGNKVMMKKDL